MLTLRAEKRNLFGKKLKSAREAGRIPVVVYGGKEPAAAFFVSAGEFKKIITEAGESSIVSLETDGGKKDVLIHEIARHPLSGELVHADFYVIDKTKKIEVKVPLRFDGLSPAVKDLGGTLVKVLHELHIEALPFDIPREIVVDIAPLTTPESQILIKNLRVPAGIKVLNQPEEVVAAMSVTKEEVEEAAPVDLSTIEVESKGKKEEEIVEVSPEEK
jgi:large subunit ribosomal protein L25